MSPTLENVWTNQQLLLDKSYEERSNVQNLAKKVAEIELREDKHTREQCLIQLRQWIKKNPDIQNCILDDSFLLRFLRAKKFSLLMAQQTLLKYLNLRRTFPDIFFNMDCLDPRVNEIINNGYIFASPFRDCKGRRLLITVGRNFDPLKYTSVEMARAHIITYETILDNEADQVLGVVHIGDCGVDCGSSFITLWPINEFITLIRWGEQSYPMRHKEIHLLHIPQLFKYAYDFCLGLVSNKLKERAFIYNKAEDLHKNVDPKLLPKEYGGVMPMSEMVKLWREELLAKRERLLSYDSIKLLSDRGIIRRRGKNTDGCETISGSFRKLEVD